MSSYSYLYTEGSGFVLEISGVKCTALETEREGHAREVVQALSLAELQSYDGIVAVSNWTSAIFFVGRKWQACELNFVGRMT